MPACGNCGKEVAASDITCPHCGALLAAYSSPIGSASPEFAVPSANPEPTLIPAVDLDVPPPVETEVVTDPAEVAEEAISTAPQPLFDTRLTVEEIVRAAESDHEDDVVTISDKHVPTKTVEFDVPDYAKPPADATPIPMVEDADPALKVITRDTPAPEPTSSSNDQNPPTTGESWLNATPAPQPRRIPKDPPRAKPEPKKVAGTKTKPGDKKSAKNAVGQTDAYLRKLHEESGYVPGTESVSAPVETGRTSVRERGQRRLNNREPLRTKEYEQASAKSTQIGCTSMYVILLVIIWAALLISMSTGGFNSGLIFVAIAATWAWRPIKKAIKEISRL